MKRSRERTARYFGRPVESEATTAVEIPPRRPAGTGAPPLADETTAVYERADDGDGIVIVFSEDDDSDTDIDPVVELCEDDTETVTDVDERRPEPGLDAYFHFEPVELETLVLTIDDAGTPTPTGGDLDES